MTKSSTHWQRLFCALLTAGIVLCSAGAKAQVAINYVETDLGGGLWQYEYIVTNTLDRRTFPGYDLFDVRIDFDPAADVSLLSLPTGWDSILDAGSAELFSTYVGPPPTGTDIPPSSSLRGFLFQFDYRAGNTGFASVFVNPNDPNTPIVFDGVTGIAAPEPGTIALVLPVLIGGLLVGRKGIRRL